MLEGLEVSEVNLNYVLNNNNIFRIDSSYFKKEFLKEESKVRDLKYNSLKNLASNIRSFGAYSLNNKVSYLNEGIPFIRGVNMKSGRINFHEMIYINERANEILWKSEVYPETVLLSMSGTLGEVAIASKNWKYPINSNQDIAKINVNSKIDPYYLYIFLSSEYGQNYVRREARGSVQQHVYLSQINDFEVPLLSIEFQKYIKELVQLSQYLFNKSGKTYQNAEDLLLLNNTVSENFKIDNSNTNTRTFSSSFLSSGRLDAEYYLPKYEQVVNKITSQKHGRLEDLAEIIKSVEPGTANYSDQGTPFIRVADYDKFGINKYEVCIKDKYCKENEEKIKKLKLKKDTVLLSKDGSVGIAYTVKKDREMLTSSAILHLKIKDKNKLLPEYLALVLNSKLTQMQAERDGGGSIILHWRMRDVRNVLIPVIDFEKQKEINDLVKESFKLKKQSEDLLKTAKRAVEIAIEQDEEAAFGFIEKEAGGLIEA